MTQSIGVNEIITPEMVYDLSKAFDTGDTEYLKAFSLNKQQESRIAEFIPNINWLGKIILFLPLNVLLATEANFMSGNIL